MVLLSIQQLLAALLAALGVIELIDTPFIAGWGFAVAFGALFLLAAWLIRSGRVMAGAVLGALLALFEVLGFAGWKKDGPADWIIAVATLIVSLVVLAVFGRLLLFRRSRPGRI